MPEMSARVNFLTRHLSPEESKQILAIPEKTLLKGVSAPTVFKIVKDRVEKTQIKVGKRIKDYVQVLEGLNIGDRVVLNPGKNLENGQRVKIAEY